MIAVRGLTKLFRGRAVLQDVNLSFDAGSSYLIVGPNGAGKTVLLKILAGVYSPDAGTVLLNGQDYSPFSAREAIAHGIAYVPQIPYIPTQYTMRQIRTLIGGNALVDFSPHTIALKPHQSIGTLPYAERQIAECQIALARRPHVLLLDEPRFALIPKYASAWQGLLDYCRGERLIVLVVLHTTYARRGEFDGIINCERGRMVHGSDSPAASPTNVQFDTSERSPAAADSGGSSGKRLVVTLGNTDTFSILQPGVTTVFVGLSSDWEARIALIVERLLRAPELCNRVAVLPGHMPDRGLALSCSLQANLELGAVDFSTVGWIRRTCRAPVGRALSQALSEFQVQPSVLEEKAGNLSGGNKQRLCFARLFLRSKDCLVCINPWRGLDLGGIRSVTERLLAAVAQGHTVVVLTDDLEEATCFAKHGLAWCVNTDGTPEEGLPPNLSNEDIT